MNGLLFTFKRMSGKNQTITMIACHGFFYLLHLSAGLWSELNSNNEHYFNTMTSPRKNCCSKSVYDHFISLSNRMNWTCFIMVSTIPAFEDFHTVWMFPVNSFLRDAFHRQLLNILHYYGPVKCHSKLVTVICLLFWALTCALRSNFSFMKKIRFSG